MNNIIHFERTGPPAEQTGRWSLMALGAVLALAGMHVSAHAQQSQGMEERLRAQLRITTSQLQQAQNELSALKSGGATSALSATARSSATPAEVDALKNDLAQARAELRASQRSATRVTADSEQLRTQAQSATEKAGAQVAQFRDAYDELLKLARASETERQLLASDTALQHAALKQCEAKNTQLYAVGQEILHAYETLDVGSVMASRQPFAAQSRVKYEQIAQQYGDKLYEGRLDVPSLTVPAASQTQVPIPPRASAEPVKPVSETPAK